MIKYLKYLKAILTFKQVAQAYKAEQGKDKPAFLSRRVIGIGVTAVGGVLTAMLNIDLSGDLIGQVSNHLGNIADSVYIIMGEVKKVIPDILALYGIILIIKGQIGKNQSDRRGGNNA